MSPRLISHSDDLRRLRDEGYEVAIKAGHLVLHHVPYVTPSQVVAYGTLVSTLALAGERTIRPDTHVVSFIGEYPCHRDGSPIEQLRHQSARQDLGSCLVVDHSFSNKPKDGYPDYYEKMTSYVRVLSGPAQALDPSASAITHALVALGEDTTPFVYENTHASRAGISAINEKLMAQRIGVIGLGGTGGYVLDFVTKTPVQEIHIYDDDRFVQHNAFRAPGAASIDELRNTPFKVDYWTNIYSRMHKGVVGPPFLVTAENANEIAELDFVFVCVDKGQARRVVSEALEQAGASFIDVGMGLEVVDGQLQGIVRATTSTETMRGHYRSRVSLEDGTDDAYKTNIQIAELNALNAALAVVKWKKLQGFYADREREHNCTYTIDVNMIVSDDHATP